MHILYWLHAPCDFCSKVLSAKCLFIFFVLFSCFLVSSPLCFKCNSLAMHYVCNVSCEVRVCARFEVWMFFVRCEHVRLEVSIWVQSLRLKVWGWRLKVWSSRFLCQLKGLRCEAFYEVKGLRLEMWSRRLKVWGMKFLCQVEGLRSMVWSVKLFAKGWRYLYVRSKVWSLRSNEVGALSFEHFFCEVWGLRLECSLWV